MTLSDHLETILTRVQRDALVAVLRNSPELTLERLHEFLAGEYGETLRTITVGELVGSISVSATAKRVRDSGPPIDRNRLDLAKRSEGADYDRLVYDAIVGADGLAVSAGYLRARVGGPRWKLQGSLRRLVEAGRVERSGVTSSTRYRVGRAGGRSPFD